jgi:protein-S-isoprenylcysteine O-methyltransferase Ste14
MKKTLRDYVFVGIQFLLFAMFLLPITFTEVKFPIFFTALGGFVCLLGGFIIMLSLLQLNTNLSPFPSPKKSATLVTSGLYKYVRHPIYSGIILLFLGFSVFEASIYKILISCLVWFLFYLKSEYEEQKLTLFYKEYSQYRKKTGRFSPKVF